MKDNLTILLIDDDPDDRQLFAESVHEVDASIECITIGDCGKALNFLKEREDPPDYIFLDLHMPGLDGKKCLSEIKSYGHTSNVPIIIYTTSTDVEDALEVKQLGATHFISKPVDPREIYYMISQVINEKWA